MDKRTKELFNWATANVSESTELKQTPLKLDTGVLDAVLGPDDSQLMLESMHAIQDTSLTLDER